MLEALLERLVEADHHRPGRVQPLFDDRALSFQVLGDRVLELGVAGTEVLGQDLAAPAGDPVDTRGAQACGHLGVAETGAIGEVDELGDRQRVELDAFGVAGAHRRKELLVVAERQARVEPAVEADEVASELEQLVDLREDLLV